MSQTDQHAEPAQDAPTQDNRDLRAENTRLLRRIRELEAGAAAAAQPAPPTPKDEEESRRWLGRARALSNNTASITIGDQRYTKRQCYIRALEANPDHGAAWGDLGEQAYNNLVINGRDYSQADDNNGVVLCYEQQLRCSPRDSRAWQLLASHCSGGGARSINGKLLTQFQCYELALLHDARNVEAWLGLARNCFANNEDLIEVNGEPMGRLTCCAQVIGVAPQNDDAWNTLAACMEGTDHSVTLANGTAYSHGQLGDARQAIGGAAAAGAGAGDGAAAEAAPAPVATPEVEDDEDDMFAGGLF